MDRRSVKSSNRSVLDRMAEVEAEYAAHKLRQEAKDREFAELLRSIEAPPEKAGLFLRAHFNSYCKKTVHSCTNMHALDFQFPH